MMNDNNPMDFLDKPARIISVAFHPLLMTIYGLVILFSAPTILGYLPFTIKRLLLLIVLVNNVLLPLAILPLFRYRNIISSWTIDNRRERNLPLLITTILYASTAYIIMKFQLPLFLKSFFFAAFFVSLLVTLINFWWKISIHAVGAGALFALILILSLKLISPLPWYLISVSIMSGLLLSSRLKLNSHNPQQVWFGYLTGCLSLGLFMWFI
jgi:hypothetical protein